MSEPRPPPAAAARLARLPGWCRRDGPEGPEGADVHGAGKLLSGGPSESTVMSTPDLLTGRTSDRTPTQACPAPERSPPGLFEREVVAVQVWRAAGHFRWVAAGKIRPTAAPGRAGSVVPASARCTVPRTTRNGPERDQQHDDHLTAVPGDEVVDGDERRPAPREQGDQHGEPRRSTGQGRPVAPAPAPGPGPGRRSR